MTNTGIFPAVRSLPGMRAYALAADTGSPARFAGASTISGTPITMRIATPARCPRSLASRNAMIAITAAWAKLDYAAKAIRLR